MAAPIRFYFDFASPYAYFSLEPLQRLAARHRREIKWYPVLTWAVLKAQNIPAPADSAAKWRYIMHDMVRSANYFGVPYRHPPNLPLSSHRAARLYYGLAEDDPAGAVRLACNLFSVFFAKAGDIADPEVLCQTAGAHGMSRSAAVEAMDGEAGRRRLAAVIEQAVAEGVCGSPFFIIDGEGFFGADRLPQIAWRLSGTTERVRTS